MEAFGSHIRGQASFPEAQKGSQEERRWTMKQEDGASVVSACGCYFSEMEGVWNPVLKGHNPARLSVPPGAFTKAGGKEFSTW